MSKALADKIIEIAPKYHLSFKLKKWPTYFSSAEKYTDLESSVIINGQTYYGFGTDRLEEMAITKATVEAIERAVINDAGTESSSNGIAGHTCIEEAKKFAANELIERDSFLFHMITRTSPEIIQFENDSLIDDIVKLGFDVVIKKLDSDQSVVVVLMEAYKDGGVCISLGVGSTRQDAINSAAIQLTRIAIDVFKKAYTPLDNNDFLELYDADEIAHLRLGLAKEYCKTFKDWMNFNRGIKNNLIKKNITFRQLFPKDQTLKAICKELELVFVKAECDMAQELYFGPYQKDKINLNKFNAIGYKVPSDIIPHPLC